jgi:phage protein D
MINNPAVESTQRFPQAVIKINGEYVTWETIDITNQNYYLADRYTVELPLYGNNEGFPLNTWGNITTGNIEIYMGFVENPNYYTQGDLTQIFGGIIDSINIDPVKGRVTLKGRDYAARLIDKKITETFLNQTSSQIVARLAAENGLNPVVTPTTTPVGIYFNNYVKVTSQYTQWDLVSYLAQEENFNVFLINKNLYFEPKPTSAAPAYVLKLSLPTLYGASPVGNFIDIEFGRSLTLAEDARVTVLSYSQLTGNVVRGRATSTHIAGSAPSRTQQYVFSFPNLSAQQASQKAQSLLANITQHELLLNATLIPDVTLTKNTPVQVTGTNSVFDQIYYLDTVTRSFSAKGGINMQIQAKNHNTNSQVIL